ncbi:MAG: 6-phosphofructokinase, partial [Oscillospiraceae bacterium]|nr:6-phosphofructokinase [Oscillospiraceae bacterium]
MFKNDGTIAVLTSGGDAPGMNAAIRAVVRTAYARGIEVLGVRRGYTGLINGDFIELGIQDVSSLTSQGGTYLYTARSPEFMSAEGQDRAASACKYRGVKAVIVIGGDGSFRGCIELSKRGLATIGIPATIDNDIACTNYTIGFDTAANTAIEAIDKLNDTMRSHERCSVVEVMGRNAGHLAVYVGIATGACSVIVPERPFDFDSDISERIRRGKLNGRNHFIVIVAEGTGITNEVAARIERETGIATRVTILGHVQRGGRPSARDRVTASRMGKHAVELLSNGKRNRLVGIINGTMHDFDIG